MLKCCWVCLNLLCVYSNSQVLCTLEMENAGLTLSSSCGHTAVILRISIVKRLRKISKKRDWSWNMKRQWYYKYTNIRRFVVTLLLNLSDIVFGLILPSDVKSQDCFLQTLLRQFSSVLVLSQCQEQDISTLLFLVLRLVTWSSQQEWLRK